MNLHRLITCYISKLRVLRSTSIIQVDMLKIFFFFFFRFSPYNILQILLILSRTETQVLLFAPKSQHLMTKYVTKEKKKKMQNRTTRLYPHAPKPSVGIPHIGKRMAREISSSIKNFKKELAVKELHRKTVLPSSYTQKSKSQTNQ